MKEYPLTCVIVVAILGMVFSIVTGTILQRILDIEPEHTVEVYRVIYDGEFEKHIELVELTVKGEFNLD